MVKIIVKIMAKIMAISMVIIMARIMVIMVIMVKIMVKTIRLLSAVSKRPRLMPKMVTKTRSTGKELAYS